MRTVADDEECGHGGAAEAVEEGGFQFAFHKVEDNEGAEEELIVGDWGWIWGAVDFGAEGREEEYGVDEDWAEIFDHVHSSPAKLAACI